MPAPAGFKRLLEVALPEIVQSGPPTTWINLKLSLARYGLAPEVLDEYRQDIWNMFQEFLDAANNKHSRSQSRPARDRTPPSSCSRSVSSDESYAVHYNRQSKAKLTQDRAQEREDGWVQPVEMSSRENPPKLGVILCFSSGKENLISAHVIKQYKKQNERHLAHHDKGDTVELVCGLDSQPSRMYHVKFRVEEDADFDILLGKHWQGDEPDETGGKKSRKPRIEREYHDSDRSPPSFSTSNLLPTTEVAYTRGSRKRRQAVQAGSGTPYYCSCIHRATNGQDSRSPTHFRADKRFGQERAGRERNGSGTRKRKVSRDLRPAIMVGLVSGTICWAMNEFLDSASDSEEELW